MFGSTVGQSDRAARQWSQNQQRVQQGEAVLQDGAETVAVGQHQ